MIIAVYGCACEREQFARLLHGGWLDGCRIELAQWGEYDEFIKEYRAADALFVLADGGEGLEVMNAAQTIAPNVPRCWFTADKALGSQAMRMDAAFFAPKPLTAALLREAFKHCGIKSNYIVPVSYGEKIYGGI